jgi:hypothetical protein
MRIKPDRLADVHVQNGCRSCATAHALASVEMPGKPFVLGRGGWCSGSVVVWAILEET